MPQAIDLVLNNASAVSKTFTLATPAGPQGSAVWYLREGANHSVFPKIECSSAAAAGGSGRKVKISLNLPAPVVNASGVTVSSAKMSFNLDVTIPDFVPDSVRDEGISFVKDLLATELVASVLRTGYAPS